MYYIHTISLSDHRKVQPPANFFVIQTLKLPQLTEQYYCTNHQWQF